MTPTETLTREHRIIERVLDGLQEIAKRGHADGLFDHEAATECVDLLQAFADGHHHAKEEEVLFPALERLGFSRDAGPTAVMRAEHVDARALVARMAQALEDHRRDGNEAETRFLAAAACYLPLLREHIRKEDHCLFPMAAASLRGADAAAVEAAFDRLEHDAAGRPVTDGFRARTEALAARLALAPLAPSVSAPSGHG